MESRDPSAFIGSPLWRRKPWLQERNLNRNPSIKSFYICVCVCVWYLYVSIMHRSFWICFVILFDRFINELGNVVCPFEPWNILVFSGDLWIALVVWLSAEFAYALLGRHCFFHSSFSPLFRLFPAITYVKLPYRPTGVKVPIPLPLRHLPELLINCRLIF